MRKLLATIFMLGIFTCAIAIPALRLPFTVNQPDGTLLTVCPAGDEMFHFLSTTDGIPVIMDAEGAYCYATVKDGELVSSGIMAHDKSLRPAEETGFADLHGSKALEFIRCTHKERMTGLNNARAKGASKSARHQKRVFGHPTSFTGKKKGLVILVNFKNLKMKENNTPEAFWLQFNQPAYCKNGHIGSVHDYFYDQSYGKLDLEFDIIGPVTVSKDYAFYGKNVAGMDAFPAVLVEEACKLADNLGVDFSEYDWNGNGYVEQVFLIYAGYGENYGASSSTIWPHESTMEEEKTYEDGNGEFTLDDVTINTYAVTCELRGTSGNNMDGIGAAVHEFSHCFGLPDTYDTSYNGGFGMSFWDLLDQGSYGGDPLGSIPTGYTAYERWFAGWLDPIELNSPCEISGMPNIEESATAYIIYNDGNRDEFFMLENRQNYKWFEYLSTYTNIHGMLVTHIDYDRKCWEDDLVNNDATHQRLSIVPADGSYGTLRNTGAQKTYLATREELAGDVFPGSKNVTSLTGTSHTNCGGKLFNPNTDGTFSLNKDITDIREKNGLISFSFMGGTAASVTETWQPDMAAESYYTINGIMVDGKPDAPGIYIMRKNGDTHKVIIR